MGMVTWPTAPKIIKEWEIHVVLLSVDLVWLVLLECVQVWVVAVLKHGCTHYHTQVRLLVSELLNFTMIGIILWHKLNGKSVHDEPVSGIQPMYILSLNVMLSLAIIQLIVILINDEEIVFLSIHTPPMMITKSATLMIRLILFEMIHDFVLTVWTSVPSWEPLFDTCRMETMKTWQNHILFVNFVLAHANCAWFVLLWKLLFVALCKLIYW